MSSPPDVVAWPLEEALAELRAAGWTPQIRTTSPPQSAPAGGLQRVVRQRATAAGQVELVVAWERYVRLRRPRSEGPAGPHRP
ncbi:MAG: PASTA domain-containing protein [Firmicutes bacterium]|jgi:hypothetical protein|nr:PASTA domain-containing protein [Bacillota bacterium]GBD28015.1 hypothetical protein HRbin31_00027 [bacterium HR31]